MLGMTTPISIEQIDAMCRPAARQVAIRLVAETGSTNTDLLDQLAQFSDPVLLIAESQTAGKGRAGRTWHSAPGATLTFSLAWKFELPPQALLGLPLATGVAITEALAQFGIEAKLKWPNDILRDGKKMGGILIETASAKAGSAEVIWAVIGVGINMSVPAGLAALIDAPVAAAPALQVDRNRVLAALLNELSEAMIRFEQQGFSAFRDQWNALHAYAGQPVAILDRGQVLQEGTAAGVDDSGCLLLDTRQGRIAVAAGDVSLRARGS